jgi:hypothetical protein
MSGAEWVTSRLGGWVRGKGEADGGTNHVGFRCVTTAEMWKKASGNTTDR